MKKLFAILVVACMLATFVACNNNAIGSDTSEEETTTVPEEVTSDEEGTADPDESTTVDETEEEETTTEEDTTEFIVAETILDKNGNIVELDKYGVAYNEDGSINPYSRPYFRDSGINFSGTYYLSVQEAFDAVEVFRKENPDAAWNKGFVNIKNMIDFQYGDGFEDYTFGPVYVNVPDDDNFYGMFYNAHECDIRFSIGVTYDDCNPTPGYAYYSQLWRLDMNLKLNGTCVYIWSDTEGFTPGYYKMELVNDTGTAWNYNDTGTYNYNYVYQGPIDQFWPYEVAAH